MLLPSYVPRVRNAGQTKLLDEIGIAAEDVPVDQFIPLGRMLYKAPSDGKWGSMKVRPLSCFLLLVQVIFLQMVSKGTWSSGGIARLKIDYLLFIVGDVGDHPNPDEVVDVKYVNREQLKMLKKADAGEEGLKLSPWFRLVVDNFLFKWWDHVERVDLKEVADVKIIHKLT